MQLHTRNLPKPSPPPYVGPPGNQRNYHLPYGGTWILFKRRPKFEVGHQSLRSPLLIAC
ncbi:hypothetical protein B0T17DRAFT_531555 [Bombardia bombarda]|uniref:Uncharacterized protein n=1 Tax=Bombardia bombarda TaxID=252184 RepID=A0AA39X0D4_9PEZI|nr:hypothetical protein B0T17DRAFT_531555 [Bombardia bombarda]